MRSALEQNPAPGGCPVNTLFVVPDLRSAVIHLDHSSVVSCHPGVRWTLYQIQQLFWWPSMTWDITEYVMSCPICARNKSSNRATTGSLLQPLSIPCRPWSHISLDFVTGLPPSDGNTVILMLVDRFSKIKQRPRKQLRPSSKMWFACMGSCLTWCRIGVLNS